MPSPPGAPTRKLGKNAFFFIILTVFIDMLAFGVIIPSIPTLIAELVHGEEALAAASDSEARALIAAAAPWGGYLSAVYALMNFIMGPVLGGLSDRFGRRPVLLISMGTLAVDFIIMGLAQTISVLFIARVLSGMSGATHSTASAYIADTTEAGERARAFGMLGAAFGLAFIIGPGIGGLLAAIDPRAPFFAAAALCAVNFAYGLFVLPESLGREDRRAFDWKRANPFGAFQHFVKLPHIAWLILGVGLYQFAHWVYPSTFNYFGRVRFGWDEAMVGLALVAVGVGSAVVQAGLIGVIMKRLGPARTVALGLGATVIAMTGYGLAPLGWMVFLIIPVGALGGLFAPAMNQIMTSRTARNAQGELQGALASLNALGAMVAPLVMTQTLAAFSRPDAPVHLPGAAFLLGAVITALAVAPILRGLGSSPPVEERASPGPPDGVGESIAAAEAGTHRAS